MRRTRQCRTPNRGTAFSSALDWRSTDPNAHVAGAAGIPLPAAIVAVIVAVGVGGAAVEGKAAKTAVEACELAAMDGERTRPAVPNHCESTAAESAAGESATHVRAHSAMRGHTTMRAHPAVSAAVSTPTVSPTALPATAVSAAAGAAGATRGRNGWGKGNRRADCNGGGEGHDALSEHGLVPPGGPSPSGDANDGGLRRAERAITCV